MHVFAFPQLFGASRGAGTLSAPKEHPVRHVARFVDIVVTEAFKKRPKRRQKLIGHNIVIIP